MGYCMELENAKFTIKRENLPGARKAMKALQAQAEKVGGGGGSGGLYGQSYRCFSWMHGVDLTKLTFTEAMDAWRFPVEVDEDTGDITGINFEGEKLGDEMHMFNAIAPFVEKGSFIEMLGEDGTHWRWKFDGKTCTEVIAQVIWGDEEEDEDDRPSWPGLD